MGSAVVQTRKEETMPTKVKKAYKINEKGATLCGGNSCCPVISHPAPDGSRKITFDDGTVGTLTASQFEALGQYAHDMTKNTATAAGSDAA